MKGNFLSSLIGHVREQKINKTSCGFVLAAHWQRIQTKYGWMHACVCVMIFQKQLQHIVNMSMIAKEKYLLNSFPTDFWVFTVGRGSYYTYSKRVLNFWIKTWWRSRNKWLHIYRQMHMSNNVINKQHMNTNCLMLLNEMSTHVKDCISFRGIDRHDPLDQCFDHSESGQD